MKIEVTYKLIEGCFCVMVEVDGVVIRHNEEFKEEEDFVELLISGNSFSTEIEEKAIQEKNNC